MDAEPSNHELLWRIETIRQAVGALVSRAEYAARLEAAEHRFAEIAKDVQDLSTRLDVHERNERENRASWRTILYTTLPATIVAILAILTQIWISKGGR